MKNKAEEFVFHICRETFLSIWSYANPRGKDNKELCDILAGEENLLALFLHSGRKLPENHTAIPIEGESWDSFVKKPEYLRKKEEDKISYLWDDLIEDIAKDVLSLDCVVS